jgi:hypothetical protein
MITALYRLLDLLSRFGRRRPIPHPADPFRPPAEPVAGTGSDSHRRSNRLRAVTGDAGMTTAEYAVGTVAAVAFAVVLFKVVQSPAVHSALAAVVTGALHVHM